MGEDHGPDFDDWEYCDPEPGPGARRRRRSWSRRHFRSLDSKSWDQAKIEAKQTISKGRYSIHLTRS